MVTHEVRKYYVVADLDGKMREIRPLEMDVAQGIFTPKTNDTSTNGPFRVKDYIALGSSDIVTVGKPLLENNPLIKLRSGSIVAVQNEKTFHLKTEAVNQPRQDEDFWAEMNTKGGPLNDAEKTVLFMIAGEYAAEFRSQRDAEGSPIYRALTMDSEKGGPPSKEELLERLRDPELPIERTDERFFNDVVRHLSTKMTYVQATFVEEFLQALKARHTHKPKR
jgi:hypothetical protein